MDLLVVGIIVLALYAIVRLIGAIGSGLSGARYRAYRTLAKRYRGRYEHRGMVDPPTVSFGHDGSSVRVGLAPVVPGSRRCRGPGSSPGSARACRSASSCSRSSAPPPSRRPRGTRLVRLGDPVFDRHYVVRANDPEIAGELLGRHRVREAIEGLRKLAPPAGMLVSVNPERLLVQIDRNLGQSLAALEAAVRESLILHDLLRRSVAARMAEGIAIVDGRPATRSPTGPRDLQGLQRADRPGRGAGRLRLVPDAAPPGLLELRRQSAPSTVARGSSASRLTSPVAVLERLPYAGRRGRGMLGVLDARWSGPGARCRRTDSGRRCLNIGGRGPNRMLEEVPCHVLRR